MAAYKFFNIGKANAEIDRLTSELAAKPASAEASHLADALASNETISTQLAQANADLVTAKASLASTNAALEKAQGEVNAMGAAIKVAAESLKLELKADASHAQNISAVAGAVASTLAKLNIAPEKIPVAKPATGTTDSTTKTRTAFAAMKPSEQLAFSKSGGKITD